MPEPNHNMTRPTRPGLLLNVAIVVCLSIVIMPCTVFAAESPATAEYPATVQPDCHGVHDVGDSVVLECCCDPLALTGGEAPKTQRVCLVAIVPADPLPMPAAVHFASVEQAHPPPRSASRQPVYLRTQRLRI